MPVSPPASRISPKAIRPIPPKRCGTIQSPDAASDGSRRNGTPNPDRFAITDEVCEVVDVVTTPETNPEMFRCRVKCLMYSGLSQAEAEKVIASTPLKLELFYDVGRGSFAIDAEAVGNTPLYNPYTGKEIPDET